MDLAQLLADVFAISVGRNVSAKCSSVPSARSWNVSGLPVASLWGVVVSFPVQWRLLFATLPAPLQLKRPLLALEPRLSSFLASAASGGRRLQTTLSRAWECCVAGMRLACRQSLLANLASFRLSRHSAQARLCPLPLLSMSSGTWCLCLAHPAQRLPRWQSTRSWQAWICHVYST